MHDTQSFLASRHARDEHRQVMLVSDDDEFQPGVSLKRRDGSAYDDLGTEITAHRID
jgi:hypothetical protein